MNNKTETLLKEEIFHDGWAEQVDPHDVCVDGLDSICTMPETRAILKYLGDVRDKNILELGCGCGEMSVYFAKKGANVIASDLSSGMLELVQKVAHVHNASLKVHHCSADDTGFPDQTFDIVYAANLLHHVDVEKTIREVHRVLKHGGHFVAWDPIAYNPAINIYRRMATEVRTDDEHPLKRKDIKTIKKYFQSCSISGYWLLTLVIFIKFYFWDKVDPNKERYWKRIITCHRQLKPLYIPLACLDYIILKIFPFMKWMAWNIVIITTKKQ
jgi:SAM-dependent methyltransferase